MIDEMTHKTKKRYQFDSLHCWI